MKTLKDLIPKDKIVFYRPDYNVPLADGAITDDFRIAATFPTLDYLIEGGAKIVIGSHIGRPDGVEAPEFSLRPVAERLADQYPDHTVQMAHKLVDPEVKDAIATMEELCHACKWEVLARHDKMFPPGYSIHELGTCRMGSDPKKSVLNGFNQSHDVKNLFVIDGGAFVSGGSQNPTLTILALTMRASEYLAEKMKRGEV